MKISPKVFSRQNIQKLMMVNMSMNQVRRRYGNRASTCVEDGCVTMTSTRKIIAYRASSHICILKSNMVNTWMEKDFNF